MKTFTILLAQTRTEAIFEIIFLLSVSAIIGYVTAWLYYKSSYNRKIKTIESEKNEIKKMITNLNAENDKLHRNIHDKDNEIEHLVVEVKALRILHAKDVHENDGMALKNIRMEQKLNEKDEAMLRIAQRRHLLDYKSFGIAVEEEKDDLKMISGIGPFIEERLHALDIYTFKQISKFTHRDIETINKAIEYFSGRIERDEWIAQSKELLHSKEKRIELFKRISDRKSNIVYNRIGVAKKEESDDLTIISGIGGWIQEKLNALDIYTFRQISNFTKEDIYAVNEAIEYFPGRIERDEWTIQAKDLIKIEGKKAELNMRIKERKERIFYDRLGIAHKHQANNLTLIQGISLWMEERLNMVDIYTFEQISKLTAKDVDTLTEILEIAPGQIDQNHWVTQAYKLANKEIGQLTS